MLVLHCPVCKKEFVSELSMRNHHRNLHDTAFWAQIFEKTLNKELEIHPEKKDIIQSTIANTKSNVIDKAKSLEEKGKAGLALSQHIKNIKAQNKPKNK